MKIKSRNRRFITKVSTVAIVVLSAIGIYLGLQFVLATTTPWVTVASGSMIPALEVGDLVVVQGVSPTSIRVGDIIVFESPRGSQMIHRVTKKETLPNGTLQFKTKGDANPSEDLYWISERNIYGKILYRIPYLGWLALDPTIPILTAVTIIIVVLIWPQNNRKRKK